MSHHHDKDYRFSSDTELLAHIAWLMEVAKDEAEADKPLAEFRRRYEVYTERICGAILEHIIAPVRMDGLLRDIFFNVKKNVKTVQPPEPILDAAKIRRHIHDGLNRIICNTFLEKAKDNELLTQMKVRGVSEQATYIAFQAHRELTRRYEPSLLKYCQGLRTSNLDSEVAQDIVSATFLKILMRAETYDDHGITDHPQVSALTWGWMESIARNIFMDLERECSKQPMVYFDRDEALEALLWQSRAWRDFAVHIEAPTEAEEACQKNDPHLECLNKAIRTVKLTPRERDILRVKLQKDFTEEERHEAFKAIERSHGIKSANRRKIYSRMCVKLGDCMAALCEECRRRILKKRLSDEQARLDRQALKKAAQT
jgi:DNA-directed RNA polymerase specialized sigma24 family protein